MQKVGVLGGPLPEQLRSKLGGPSSGGLRRSSIRIDQLKSEEIPEVHRGRITIDTSGRGYEDWLASIGGEAKLKSVIKKLYDPDKNVREDARREFNGLRQGNTKISKNTGNTRQQRAAFTPDSASRFLGNSRDAAKYLTWHQCAKIPFRAYLHYNSPRHFWRTRRNGRAR